MAQSEPLAAQPPLAILNTSLREVSAEMIAVLKFRLLLFLPQLGAELHRHQPKLPHPDATGSQVSSPAGWPQSKIAACV